ncbi:hypothetical protein TNCV_601181 [Trichonephila clavipes]|nr:hypothetical protein TNCV_601181 [Trichonephila clavipes]
MELLGMLRTATHIFVDFIKFDSPCGIKAAGNETLAALGKGTIKDNSIEKTISQEDLSDSETDREEDAEPTSDRQLRNHSLLQKPKRFEDHIMEAESILDDYNPETYEEAINSKDSTNWKKAMESEMNSLSENHTWELSDLPVGAKSNTLQAVGSLMYLMVGTRPDLAYSVGFLRDHFENPSAEDIVKLSQAQPKAAIVATSTTEAEVIAASEAAKEVIWLCRLIQGIVNLREIPTLQVATGQQ